MTFDDGLKDLGSQASRMGMNPVILDSNNKPVLIQGYFGLIDHLKKQKILKKKFLTIPEIEQMILEEKPTKEILKQIKKKNQPTWNFTIKRFYEMGGSLELPEGDSTILDVLFAPLEMSLKAATWASARKGDTIIDKIDKAKAKKLPEFYDKLFVRTIEKEARENGLTIKKKLRKYQEDWIVTTYFGGGDIAILPVIHDLVNQTPPNRLKVRDEIFINYSNELCETNGRFWIVWSPPKELKEPIKNLSEKINFDFFGGKLGSMIKEGSITEAWLLVDMIYCFISSLLPLVDFPLKKELLSMPMYGYKSTEEYINGEIGFLTAVFYQPGTIARMVESVLRNPKVRRITDQPGQGQRIKQALLNLENYIVQVIRNAKNE